MMYKQICCPKSTFALCSKVWVLTRRDSLSFIFINSLFSLWVIRFWHYSWRAAMMQVSCSLQIKQRLWPCPPPPPAPAFMFSTSPQTFNCFSLYISCLLSFSFSTSSLKNHPFLFPCSLCVARQPCNCGPCEERGWAPYYCTYLQPFSQQRLCSCSIVIG